MCVHIYMHITPRGLIFWYYFVTLKHQPISVYFVKVAMLPVHFESLSHRAWLMACIYQTRQIGWHNRSGLTNVPMSHKMWEVCTFMNSVCGTIIFILSLTSSYCSLPNAKRALQTGTPSYGNTQRGNTAHMQAGPILRAYNTIHKLSHCTHWTILSVLVSVNTSVKVFQIINIKLFSQLLYHNYTTILYPGAQQSLFTFKLWHDTQRYSCLTFSATLQFDDTSVCA